MFAERYIGKNCIYKPFINQPTSDNLGICVVIPCFREPDILKTLGSLSQCIKPDCNVEVIIVVNEPETASTETKEFNSKTFVKITDWKNSNNNSFIDYFPIRPASFLKKWAGAGLARKTGMDEAIRRFNSVNKSNGIIISLDADTLVERNYLGEIEKHFLSNEQEFAATIKFKHQTEGLSEKHIVGITLYEQYLDYYKKAMAYTGFLHAIHTVGSAFAVTADAYVKQGGMNKKQAGEDFYFLHKLTALGKIGEINSTCVYPSARISDRVPFGTGPILQKWVNGTEDLTITYNFEAFADLKQFFSQKNKLYKIGNKEFMKVISSFPTPIYEFLEEDRFWEELDMLNQNCSQLEVFQKRFFQLFNAFKILKYLNFSHTKFYQKEKLIEQVAKLELKI